MSYTVRDINYFNNVDGPVKDFIMGVPLEEHDKEYILSQFINDGVGSPLVYEHVLLNTKKNLESDGLTEEDRNVRRYKLNDIDDEVVMEGAYLMMALRLINLSREDHFFPVVIGDDFIFTFSEYELGNFEIDLYA